MKKKKTGNQKVKNATSVVIDNIKFRSKLEGYCYQRLKDNNIKANYEFVTFTLLDRFKFYEVNSGKYKQLQDWCYTPDFIGSNFIIECKGKPTDRFPLVWKMFKYRLVELGLDKEYKLYLVHNHKEIDEMIQNLK